MAQSQSTAVCIVCHKETVPGNRAYLKPHEEPFISVQDVLLSVSGRMKEEVDGFLNTYTVSCKAGCYSVLKKLARLRKETAELMANIEKRIGSFLKVSRLVMPVYHQLRRFHQIVHLDTIQGVIVKEDYF